MAVPGSFPLSTLVAKWPFDVLTPGNADILNDVGFLDLDISHSFGEVAIDGKLVYDKALVFEIPWLPGCELALATEGAFASIAFSAFIREPGFEVRFLDPTVALQFPSTVLVPMKKVGDEYEVDETVEKLRLELSAEIVVNHRGLRVENAPTLTLSPFQIGNSGIVIDVQAIRLCLREQDMRGLPPSIPSTWRGVFIESASIHLPSGLSSILPPDVLLEDLFIGVGGFSGKATGSWSPTLAAGDKQFTGPGSGDLFGIPFGLEKIDLEFIQSSFKSSSLSGQLILPFFDQPVNVDISIGVDGGLAVALSATQPTGVAAANGLITFTKPGLLKMTLDSIRFELDAGVFTAKLAGQITPLAGASSGLKWPTFDVQELAINSKGEAWIEGGWINLPKAYTLNLHMFKLEITKFGLGRTDSGEKYLGFSGGLDLIKGIPAGGAVEGLRIIWDDALNVRLTMKGVGVNFSIPGTLDFDGSVSYDDNPGFDLKAFTGEMKLNLPTIDLKLDAKVVFGSDRDMQTLKRYKYFAVYVDGEFGTAIPLLNSGLGLKGIAALFSVNYAPDKPDDWMWYSMDQSKSWFHKPEKGVTDLIRKWAPEPGTLGLGAGVALITNNDNGFLFNGKFLLLFLFPGPVVMLDGRCDFLKRPGEKNDNQEPMFHALIVLDTRAGYFLIGLDAKWKYDAESGKLVEIAGSAEAYFNYMDPRLWHIYIGQQPLEQRIRASFAGAFEANAYFMLDRERLALGVWIGKQAHYQFGPVGADLEAWLDANAVLSFRPAQLAAGLWLHGLLAVRIFKFKLAIGLDARLEAQVAKPFHILGTLTITVETRLKDFEIELRLEWGPRPERPAIAEPFKAGGIAHLKSTVEWPLDGSDVPSLPSALPAVPVDGRPWLTFEHPVHDASGVTLNPAPDPGSMLVGNRTTGEGSAYVHYTLATVAIEKHDGGSWTPVSELYGSWAAGPPNPGAGGAAANQNRLMLYAKTPLEITDESGSWNPWLSSNLPNYPCPVVVDVRVCVGWDGSDVPPTVSSPWSDAFHPEIVVRWDDGPHRIVDAPQPVAGQQRGILFPLPKSQAAAAAFVVNTTSGGTLTVIDTATDKVLLPPIEVGKFPMRAALTPDGSTILVTNQDADVRRVNTATRALIGPPIPHQRPLGIAIHPDGTRAYVTSDQARFVSVIDIPAWRVIAEVALNDISVGVRVLPNGKRVYVTRHGSLQVTVIDTATNTVVGAPIVVGLQRLWDLVATPDSATLFIPGGADLVAVLNTATHVFEKPIQVQKEPMAVALSPDGSRLWVANAASNSVSVIDVATRTVIATVPVGFRPLSVAVTPDGSKAYVGNLNANSVTVIDAATHQVLGAPIAAGLSVNWIVIASAPTSAALPRATFFSGAAVTSVDMEVPEGSALVEVVIHAVAGATALASVVDPPGFETLVIDAVSSVITVDALALGIRDGIRRVRVSCSGEWILMRVCYVRPSLPGGLAGLGDLHDQLQQGVGVWGAPGAVFEPYETYRVRAKVERKIDGVGKLGGWHQTDTFERYWFFETSGPPGLGVFTPPANVDPGKSAIGLEDLTRYVSQTMPPTLTPEGERPRLTRPVFRAYDIGADFNEDYVDRMYELAGRDLAVQIYDSSDNPVRNVSGDLAVLANQWGDAAEVQLTETQLLWLEMLNAATCMPEIDVQTIPRNKTLAAADHVLEADTLYEARLVPLLLRAVAPKPGDAGWTSAMLISAMPILTWTGGTPPPGGWTDVLVRFELQPTPSGLSGIGFRMNAQGCYVFTADVSAGRRTLVRVVGNVPNRLDESLFAFDANKSYRFSIEVFGPRLRVMQDGEAVFDLIDTTHPAGTIALLPSVSSGPPRHLDLAVHDFSKGAPVAYHFPMTTSEYVDFHHQVHSFQDEVWSATPQTPIDLATAAVRVTDPKSEVAEAEARAYETVADALLRSAARQLPERLEVTRFEQNGELQALLVRCDEPIDWSRTDLTVLRLDGEPLQTVVPGAMKLTRGAFDWMQLAGDVVEVLLREPMNPTGARVEALLLPKAILDATEPPLLVDRFVDNDFTGWTVAGELPNVSTSVSSEWHLVGSELQLINKITADGDPAFLGTFAAAGSSWWTDVVVSANVRSPNGGAVGIVFRGQGLNDYYRFSMDSQQSYRQMVKKVGGVFTVLWRDAVAYDPFSQHELTFVAEGGSLRGYLNGVAMFAVEDDAHATGIVACYVAENEAYFSNVRVDPTSRVARGLVLDERFDSALDRWTFDEDGAAAAKWALVNDGIVAPPIAPGSIASAFAGDIAWSDYRLTVRVQIGASDATDVVFRAESADRFLTLRFDADGANLRLIQVVSGVESTLWMIPWTPTPSHEHLVTIDCLNSDVTVFLDGTPIQLATIDVIAAGRIGLRVRGTTGTTFREVRVVGAAWTLWHAFENEKVLDAGTRIEIYGSSFDIALPVLTPGTIRRLAPAATRRPKLPLTADLRVIDPGAKVQHARRFIHGVSSEPLIDFDLMRNADGTGFFILPRTGMALAKGTYRLAFAYHRNQPGVTPILSRAGSQAPEFASIDVPWTPVA